MSIAELEPSTTLPPRDHTQLEALLHQLEGSVDTTTALTGPDGSSVALPPEIHTVLLTVARAMAQGRAITVAPHEQVLSTQQAADLLGVSRPTLVAICERGQLPYTQPGRHRRIRLSDVLDYQQSPPRSRRQVLDALTHEATELGIDDLPAPRHRIRG